MPRLLQDPLLRFVLLGGAVFAAYAFAREPVPAAPRDEIVVTAAQVRQAVDVFSKTWQRPPTADERAGLIERRVREEVFYREAVAAGLDEDDVVVRRRMQQKLEFMLEDIAGRVSPTEQELRAFFEANAGRFRTDPRYSFRHVYVGTDERADPAADARALLDQLQRHGARPGTLGDPLRMVEPSFENVPRREIARVLGEDFVAGLADAPVGKWWGPVASGYGLHLVFVGSRTDGELPDLDAVRDRVTREWGAAKRESLNESLYRELRKKYAITVEQE